MAKRLDLIERKLKAIRDKDVEDIVAKRVYIPFMGRAGVDKITRDTGSLRFESTIEPADISDWLEVRAKVLEDAKRLSIAEIEARIETLSKTLCNSCKKLVSLDADRTGMPCAKDYETICKIWLYQFSLGLR